MKNSYSHILSPLLSLFVLNIGVGFLSTLVPILLHSLETGPVLIGLMSTANYTGLVIGSFRAEKFILRVGHIRAFSAFASCITVATLLHGMLISPEFWLILRFLCGICLAGLYVTIESWLLSGSALKMRGRILSLYMVALYAAQSGGQFLVMLDKSMPLFLFSLAALFAVISILPLAMTKSQSPQIDEPDTLSIRELLSAAPSGAIGCFAAGILLGSMYGLYPLFIVQKLPGQDHFVSYFMAALIFGGMSLQYPFGKLSDTIERRTVLCVAFLMSAILCAVLYFFSYGLTIGISLSFLIGGFMFVTYPICIAHACDTIDAKKIVAATQALLLTYSVGAALGPFCSSNFMALLGPNGLMLFLGSVSIAAGVFLGYRRAHTQPHEQEESFLPSPQTTAVIAEIDPRSE